MTRSQRPTLQLASLSITLALALAGCASGGEDAEPKAISTIHAVPERSGFLRDYSGLKQSPRHHDTLYEMSPDLARYKSFIIDPIAVLPGATARGTPLDAETAADLASSLRSEIVDSLQTEFKIVTAPGPGVATIRSAITEVARSGQENGKARIGGAAMEVEIVDSRTGERLLAAVEADSPDLYEHSQAGDPYADTKIVFAHWAARLNQALLDAATGALPATK